MIACPTPISQSVIDAPILDPQAQWQTTILYSSDGNSVFEWNNSQFSSDNFIPSSQELTGSGERTRVLSKDKSEITAKLILVLAASPAFLDSPVWTYRPALVTMHGI
jgi:hypothetical protein